MGKTAAEIYAEIVLHFCLHIIAHIIHAYILPHYFNQLHHSS